MAAHPLAALRSAAQGHVLWIVMAVGAIAGRASAADDAPPSESSTRPTAIATMSDATPAVMQKLARFTGDRWQVLLTSGDTVDRRWEWGPGRYSLRCTNEGPGARYRVAWATDLWYWHPGRKEVCVLALHGEIPAVGRGTGEGVLTSDGDVADIAFTLHQPRITRNLATHFQFQDRDSYRESLSDVTSGVSQPMVAWDYRRKPEVQPRSAPVSIEAAAPLSPHFRPLQPLIGARWEARPGPVEGSIAPRAAPQVDRLESSTEWLPACDLLRTRIQAFNARGEPRQELDVHIYHHVGLDRLRCLALSSDGSVYEGDVRAIDGPAVQLDLVGYEGEKTTSYVVLLEFMTDGRVRQRAWSIDRSDRTLLLDLLFDQRSQ